MTLAERSLVGRDYKVVLMPANFQTYCTLCNVMVRPGMLSKRYDAATWVHETCPTTPHKTFAPHKYGSAR